MTTEQMAEQMQKLANRVNTHGANTDAVFMVLMGIWATLINLLKKMEEGKGEE